MDRQDRAHANAAAADANEMRGLWDREAEQSNAPRAASWSAREGVQGVSLRADLTLVPWGSGWAIVFDGDYNRRIAYLDRARAHHAMLTLQETPRETLEKMFALSQVGRNAEAEQTTFL